MVEFLSLKLWLEEVSQVVIVEKATSLAAALNFRTDSLVHLANIVIFQSPELVSQAVSYFCGGGLEAFSEKMN
jgi:hypothetical protein